MKNALFSLFKQDVLLSWRNGLLLVTIITLAVIVVLFWTLPILLPEEASLRNSQVFLDLTEDQMLSRKELSYASTREELESRVKDGSGVIGIIAEGSAENVNYTLVFKSLPDKRTIHVLKAVLRSFTAEISGKPFGPPVEIELLRSTSQNMAVNESMIVILLAFEVMILGFLYIAVVIFSEKKEGSILAYRVSPSGVAIYVVSKTLVFTLISTLYGLIMTAATLGPSINFAALTAVLLLSCALMTLLGLGIASFFNNISEWFITGVLILAVNMLSMIPYQIPTYSAKPLTFLPGYSVIFGVREILFPTGREAIFSSTIIMLTIQLALFGTFAFWGVRKNMMKES